jgi:FixJ family two-component response regulator
MAAVLILDDDADLREVLCEMLLLSGATSCLGASGLAELQHREHEALACDLAILDINLGPGQPSGVDASRWLVRCGFRGRILFLTGHAACHPLVVEAAKLARTEILAKPLDGSRLVELLQERP